jgi:hypothetical protein
MKQKDKTNEILFQFDSQLDLAGTPLKILLRNGRLEGIFHR